MLIYLRLTTVREVYGVEVDAMEGPGQVRAFVKIKHPEMNIRALLFAGKVLNNDRMALADYGVQKESIVTVMAVRRKDNDEVVMMAAPVSRGVGGGGVGGGGDDDDGLGMPAADPSMIRRQVTEGDVAFGDAVLVRVLEVTGVHAVSLSGTFNPVLMCTFRDQLATSPVRHKVERLEFAETTFGVLVGSPGVDHIVDLGTQGADATAEAAARLELVQGLEAADHTLSLVLLNAPGFCAPEFYLGHAEIDVRGVPRGATVERDIALTDAPGRMRVSLERHPLTSDALRRAFERVAEAGRPFSRRHLRKAGVRLSHFRGEEPFEQQPPPAGDSGSGGSGGDDDEDELDFGADSASVPVEELAALEPARAARLAVPPRNAALRQLTRLLGDSASGLAGLERRNRRTVAKVGSILVTQGAALTRDAPTRTVVLCNANLEAAGAAARLAAALQRLSGGRLRWVRPFVAGPAGRASTVLASFKSTEAAVQVLLLVQGRDFAGEPLQAAFGCDGDGPGPEESPLVLLRGAGGAGAGGGGACTAVRQAGFALAAGPFPNRALPPSLVSELALAEPPASVSAGASNPGWQSRLVVLPARGHLRVWALAGGGGGAARPEATLERRHLRARQRGDYCVEVDSYSAVTQKREVFLLRWADPLLAQSWMDALREAEHSVDTRSPAGAENDVGGAGGGDKAKAKKGGGGGGGSGKSKARRRRGGAAKRKRQGKARAAAAAVAAADAEAVASCTVTHEPEPRGGSPAAWEVPRLDPADLAALAGTARCRACDGDAVPLDQALSLQAEGAAPLLADGAAGAGPPPETRHCRRCLGAAAREGVRDVGRTADEGDAEAASRRLDALLERFSLGDLCELVDGRAIARIAHELTRRLVSTAGEGFVRCPSARCGVAYELDAAEGDETRAPGLDRRELSAEAQRHFVTNRLLCRECKSDWCRLCNESPYHTGFDCDEFRVFQVSPKCRFCGVGVVAGRNLGGGAGPLGSVCSDAQCLARLADACPCAASCGVEGHPCGGARPPARDGVEAKEADDEAAASHAEHCLPCLQPGCAAGARHDGETLCGVCVMEGLSAAPSVALGCGHAFHVRCLEERLDADTAGVRISFRHADCPLCAAPVASAHPRLRGRLEAVAAKRAEFRLALEAAVRADKMDEHERVAVNKESPFYGRPLEYAEATCVFFECWDCKRPYYAGRVECEAAADEEAGGAAGGGRRRSAQQLKCGPCGGYNSAVCKKPEHEQDWVWKCRFCCSVAMWNCFGGVRMCERCHNDNPWARHQGNHGPQAEQAKCPQPGEVDCPLRLHPGKHKNGHTDDCELLISCMACDRLERQMRDTAKAQEELAKERAEADASGAAGE